MIPTFSLEMSRHLSSLAPGFEGHWVYVNTGFGMVIMCEAVYKDSIENNRHPLIKICPAWQVEDLLMHLNTIIATTVWDPGKILSTARKISYEITDYMVNCPSSEKAYQKIEGYLWSLFRKD